MTTASFSIFFCLMTRKKRRSLIDEDEDKDEDEDEDEEGN
eukprot:CAMPEP_0170180896 /NCGR_PEP_ID=MMETSP0040_2-20121228/23337_1 /TAXON_ID=641309 /ORGANISM="Lotharella oceanica, Strain CCMP622" /LENGTH=39 /DNA_ID= /DNA_START= /DNA_END= /DNA_ORIENTATION=